MNRLLSLAVPIHLVHLAPVIGAAFKMFVPFIVILPGLIGIAVLP
jgi:SSS family solute:Na+ symporter